MNAPTETGWYWAKIGTEWEIVTLDTFDDADTAMWTVFRNGNEYPWDMNDVKEWGERVERKEAGK